MCGQACEDKRRRMEVLPCLGAPVSGAACVAVPRRIGSRGRLAGARASLGIWGNTTPSLSMGSFQKLEAIVLCRTESPNGRMHADTFV